MCSIGFARVVISAGAAAIFALILSFYRNSSHVVDQETVQHIKNWRIESEKAEAGEQRTRNYLVSDQFKCWPNYRVSETTTTTNVCRPRCHNGSFSLPGMDHCVPWLNCQDLTHVDLQLQIGEGAVKQVYRGMWQGKYVALSVPTVGEEGILFERDFIHGLQMLIELGPHDRITQLVGFCTDPLTILTEYHEFGSLSTFRQILQNEAFIRHNTQKTRFQLCLDYVQILTVLHTSPIGTRVMCDSGDLQKALSQYLLTEDFRVVVNDLDALPEVNRDQGKLIKCGHRQLEGSFVAPEQRWPCDDIPFDDQSMPPYDERADVWKIPSVCETFLYHTQDDVLLFRLFSIHKKCRSINPNDRPSAVDVYNVYSQVWNEMFTHSEIDE